MPGLDDETRTRAPVAAAPRAMLIAAELALGLDEDPSQLRHPAGHPLEQLRLGRDRVAEVGVAAGLDRGLGHRLVALHQDPHRGLDGHGRATFGGASTVNTASGQTRAQKAQLVQLATSTSATG